MKFEFSPFWKHSNCLDVFIWPNTVYDTGPEVYIMGNWMIQGTEKFWPASEEQLIVVTKKEYDNWKSYSPKGDLYGL